MTKRKSLLEVLTEGFTNGHAREYACPFVDDPPDGTETLEVPTELHSLFGLEADLKALVKLASGVPNPSESRTWMWRMEEKGAIEIGI